MHNWANKGWMTNQNIEKLCAAAAVRPQPGEHRHPDMGDLLSMGGGSTNQQGGYDTYMPQ